MKRWIYYSLAVISLAICIVSVTLWARSFWATDAAWRNTIHSNVEVASNRAGIVFWCRLESKYVQYLDLSGYGYRSSSARNWNPRDVFIRSHPNVICDYSLFGFTLGASRGARVVNGSMTTYSLPQWELGVPHWAVVALSGTAALIAIRRARRGRVEIGHCRRCGYDLRATPERCPECGTAATSSA